MLPDDLPYYGECERGINMNEQRSHFIRIMKHQAVSPCDDRARKGTVGEAVTCHEQRRVGRKEPDVDEVEDCNVIAEVEEKVVPRTFLVSISANREQIQRLDSIRDMNPPKTRGISTYGRRG